MIKRRPHLHDKFQSFGIFADVVQNRYGKLSHLCRSVVQLRDEETNEPSFRYGRFLQEKGEVLRSEQADVLEARIEGFRQYDSSMTIAESIL